VNVLSSPPLLLHPNETTSSSGSSLFDRCPESDSMPVESGVFSTVPSPVPKGPILGKNLTIFDNSYCALYLLMIKNYHFTSLCSRFTGAFGRAR
jgi:hypothetical protein